MTITYSELGVILTDEEAVLAKKSRISAVSLGDDKVVKRWMFDT